jgi:oligoribonuclease
MKENNLIWIDLEMTGLNVAQERIIEIATIVTDSELNIIEEGPVLAIHQSDELLSKMDEWNQKHHNASGLVKRVKESNVTEKDAELATLEFLRKHVKPNKSPMCGNTICMDRRFLHRYMPELEAYFHYRHLDVSTLKELAKRWAPDVYKKIKKESKHLALDDIRESIEEMLFYREHMMKV